MVISWDFYLNTSPNKTAPGAIAVLTNTPVPGRGPALLPRGHAARPVHGAAPTPFPGLSVTAQSVARPTVDPSVSPARQRPDRPGGPRVPAVTSAAMGRPGGGGQGFRACQVGVREVVSSVASFSFPPSTLRTPWLPFRTEALRDQSPTTAERARPDRLSSAVLLFQRLQCFSTWVDGDAVFLFPGQSCESPNGGGYPMVVGLRYDARAGLCVCA